MKEVIEFADHTFRSDSVECVTPVMEPRTVPFTICRFTVILRSGYRFEANYPENLAMDTPEETVALAVKEMKQKRNRLLKALCWTFEPEIPACPDCGSQEVAKYPRVKGDPVCAAASRPVETEFLTSRELYKGCWSVFATKDHIHYECETCHIIWRTNLDE